MALASAVWGDTTVNGPVSGTWTLSGSPYIVTDDIVVQSGSSLSIEPGVTVQFDGPFEFAVEGVLDAQGEVGSATVVQDVQWIHFTQDTTGGLADEDRWKGIRFRNSETGSTLRWAIIEWGYARGEWPDNCGGGLYIDGTSPVIQNSDYP